MISLLCKIQFPIFVPLSQVALVSLYPLIVPGEGIKAVIALFLSHMKEGWISETDLCLSFPVLPEMRNVLMQIGLLSHYLVHKI